MCLASKASKLGLLLSGVGWGLCLRHCIAQNGVHTFSQVSVALLKATVPNVKIKTKTSQPVSVDQASCRLCTGLSHASCLHSLSFYNLQMVHMLFLWSLSPTPLSIWQIYTPETQHLPQGRLEWYQMEMFISGFSEQAEDAIGTLFLLKARLYQQQWSVGTILFSLSLVFAQSLVFWVRLFRRLKFTCLVKCALIWVFLM